MDDGFTDELRCWELTGELRMPDHVHQVLAVTASREESTLVQKSHCPEIITSPLYLFLLRHLRPRCCFAVVGWISTCLQPVFVLLRLMHVHDLEMRNERGEEDGSKLKSLIRSLNFRYGIIVKLLLTAAS